MLIGHFYRILSTLSHSQLSRVLLLRITGFVKLRLIDMSTGLADIFDTWPLRWVLCMKQTMLTLFRALAGLLAGLMCQIKLHLSLFYSWSVHIVLHLILFIWICFIWSCQCGLCSGSCFGFIWYFPSYFWSCWVSMVFFSSCYLHIDITKHTGDKNIQIWELLPVAQAWTAKVIMSQFDLESQ